MSVMRHVREILPQARGFRVDPDRALALLKRCPVYAPTPLRALDGLAAELGVQNLLAKDESSRMKLGAFKALGGAYAVARIICQSGGTDDPMAAAETAADMVFVTASAGNHGLSVAAGARVFGARAVIILPTTAPEAFTRRIRATGAEVIAGGSYDECVDEAMRLAKENDWIHLADGSWPGYTERPALILEGYTVLPEECRAVFAERGVWPTHVFLQAGVGGLAAAVAGHARDTWPVETQIIVVEPDSAPCLQHSVKAGKPVAAPGPDSNMGRLDCKNVSIIALDALRRDADVFLTVSDTAASEAVALLGRHGVNTTPSGAAGLAGLIALNPGAGSRCLIIVSEGPEHG